MEQKGLFEEEAAWECEMCGLSSKNWSPKASLRGWEVPEKVNVDGKSKDWITVKLTMSVLLHAPVPLVLTCLGK